MKGLSPNHVCSSQDGHKSRFWVDKLKGLFQKSCFCSKVKMAIELRILFNIIHEDCNKLVIVTIIKITVIIGKKYETKYIILFNKKKL